MMNDPLPSLARIDGFLYRHRLAEIMEPAVTGSGELTLQQACERMDVARADGMIIVDADGYAEGVVTLRDVLHALSARRGAALELRLADVMSRPVHTIGGGSFLYVGIGRMARLGLHHLVVSDEAARPVGMITGHALLRWRASQALAIGDEVAVAESAAELASSRRALPRLAKELLAENVSARDVAAVISGVLRDMTARAAVLSETAMMADGWGAAPARWALLVLGSGGRGESLLNFDQDNAIVHAGTQADDLWYAELGRGLNDLLNEAGIPYCRGEVMARNPFWRRSLADWGSEIRKWVFEPQLQTVLNVDIFFDFVPVHGDHALAEELRHTALELAASSAFFVQFLAINIAQMDLPLGIFGQFRTAAGRLNAKKYGLLPLVSAGRAKAVAARVAATGTAERYMALNAAGLLHDDDLAGLLAAHETILRVIVDQQLADLQAGRPPSADIEPRQLPRPEQRRLKAALRRIALLKATSTH